MPLLWRAGAVGLDVATALCSTLNLAYFLDRLLAPDESAGRRVAAVVLSAVSLGVLLESVFLLAWAASAAEPVPLFSSGGWALVRIVPFAGAAGMSALVLRRIVGAEPL